MADKESTGDPGGRLARTQRFDDPDQAYRLLVEAHRRLNEDESAAFDAALVLTLANHIGDLAVLGEAIALAEASVRGRAR